MTAPRKKIRHKRILWVLGILLLGWLSLNWFLTNRLESYLNEKLSGMVSHATNRFYKFSFDKLEVGFFDGELTVEGLALYPDSTVFERWKKVDSLPETYFDIKVERLDLQGINLTWKVRYKKLKFDSFDIHSPDVKIYHIGQDVAKDTLVIDSTLQSTRFQYETLYSYLSPYVNVLKVKDINLRRANISYVVENAVEPSVYGLKDINFYAHGFLLDKDSYDRGNILFCDNFDFRVEHPQKVLSSGQFDMNADTIRVSTTDSVIQLKGVSFEPQLELWDKLGEKPDEYLEARLNTIELNGVKFNYSKGVNTIHARTFLIDSSAIHYFEQVQEKNKIIEVDTTKKAVEPISLYKSISPIFASVSLEDINVNHTFLQYTQQTGEVEDTYILNRLDAYAKDFLIDSLTEERMDKRFWYSDNFGFKAQGIIANISTKNHEMGVGKIVLDIKDRYLRVSDFNINPIDLKTKQDFLRGTVGNLSLEDLVLDAGIDIAQLCLDNTTVRYTSFDQKENKKHKSDEPKSNVIDLMAPFLNHLSIKDIRINNTNIEFDDKLTKNVYNLRQVDAFATKFLIDANTRQTSPYLFTFDDVGLQFRNFDNYLPGKDYSIKVDRGQFHLASGHMKLDNLHVVPHDQLRKKEKSMWAFTTPFVEVWGVAYNWEKNHFNVGSLEVKDPNLNLRLHSTPKNKLHTAKAKHDEEVFDLPPFLKAIGIDSLNIGQTNFACNTIGNKDTLNVHLGHIGLEGLMLSNAEGGTVKSLRVDQPRVESTALGLRTDCIDIDDFYLDNHPVNGSIYLGFDRLDLPHFYLNVKQDKQQLKVDSKHLLLTQVKWAEGVENSSLLVGNVELDEPIIDVKQHQSNIQKEDTTTNSKFDIYRSLEPILSKLTLEKVRINEATVNYEQIGHKHNELHHGLHHINVGIDGFSIDTYKRKADLADLSFRLEDFNMPIANGFYDIGVKSLDYSMTQNHLAVSDVSMISPYKKYDFAYKHPTHADWFNAAVGEISLSGIDLETYFAKNELDVKHLNVNNVLLENFKNQQIEIEHNIMPMIYNEIHKLPIHFNIDRADIKNFEVIYEELPKKGTKPAKFFISEMDGLIFGLTNVAHNPQQMFHVNAKGKLMGTGDFTAEWIMPVRKEYDFFELTAHLTHFPLIDLNPLIQPMAPAKVESGVVSDMVFHTYATSLGATVNMRFLYNDLDLTVYRDPSKKSKHKFYTYIANKVVSPNNPKWKNYRPRMPEVQLDRDPYHSTFNYMWQILQPPVVESVGVSQGKQNFFKSVGSFFLKVKNHFNQKTKVVSEKK